MLLSANVQEEVGLRGAHVFNDKILYLGLLAVDCLSRWHLWRSRSHSGDGNVDPFLWSCHLMLPAMKDSSWQIKKLASNINTTAEKGNGYSAWLMQLHRCLVSSIYFTTLYAMDDFLQAQAFLRLVKNWSLNCGHDNNYYFRSSPFFILFYLIYPF